ncbi:ADC synthase [Chaetomium sp. MPI-SDFR-AT-0129]|nr:ADC synthase [Chaetomium sp. MPI-SDFR-AT-0129]
MPRPRILFLDAFDSFSNNITSLLTTLLDADVFVLPIDDPLLANTNNNNSDGRLPSSSPPEDEESNHYGNVSNNPRARFIAELQRYDAVVCGPGPGHPDNEADVGWMRYVWELQQQTSSPSGVGPTEEGNREEILPVLGVCLGFQSLVSAHGGRVGRLRRGLHGMVRGIVHREHGGEDGDVFTGVGEFKATLYHSLCGDIGQAGVVGEEEWEVQRWLPFEGCPDLVPLAWVEEEREDDEQGKERILMAVKHRSKPFWGVQYHPESVCTEEEGNKVIVNWFREAQRWNQARGRTPVMDGHGVARAATRPSLLSRLGTLGVLGNGSSQDEGAWWTGLETDPSLHFLSVPLPSGVQVPDIVEALELKGSERIVLDSANAAPATSNADVRGRYSIIAAGLHEALHLEHHVGDAYATISCASLGGLPTNISAKVPLARYGDIWGLVAEFHEKRYVPATEPAYTPFVGGFMGYITYEQGLNDIGIPLQQPRPHRRPDVALVWVTKSIVVDHLQQVIHVQHLAAQGAADHTWMDNTADRLRSLRSPQRRPSFNMAPPSLPPKPSRRPSMSTSIHPPQTKEYEAKVRTCQEYIAAGESYELCLTDQTTLTRPLSDVPSSPRPASRSRSRSNSFTTSISPSAQRKQQHQQQQQQKQQRTRRPSQNHPTTTASTSWTLFKRLRANQPAPFASYLRLGPATLVSASPERFLTYSRTGLCSMRPMKGTVRKSDAVATLAQAEKILHVPKEEAENLMIVDLVRHDLHGVCGAGGVVVRDLLKVEEYQSVFQMITVVEGQLPSSPSSPSSPSPRARHRSPGTNASDSSVYTGLDVLAASLPPGSMTGAPKKRSCQILQEIENHQERGLYSGVVGYMCATGRGDWSVTIRSLFRWDDEQVTVAVVNGNGNGNGEDGKLEEETHEVWRIGAGGAVTILSTAEGEREEMFTKLAGPLRTFGEEPCR